MAITIRPMRFKDKAALMEILQDTPEFKSSEVVVAEEIVDNCMKDSMNSGYYALIAEDESGITGYISYGPTPLTEGTWDIYWEAVAQHKRGKAIGSALMKTAEEQIRKAEGRLVLIETSSLPSYELTRRFYLNSGYEVVARVPDFYSPGDDKIILQKRLK